MADRREFFRQTAAAAIGIGAHGIHGFAAQESAVAMPTANAAAMMTAFGLRVPIHQAGMGVTASTELAIAVSKAGGLGTISLTNSTAERTRERVTRVKAGTDRPF